MRGRGEGSIRQRQRKDGSVFWEALVSIHGRQKSFYDDTKSGAMALARQARADAERGKGVSLESLSVEACLLEWLETSIRPRVRARTYKSYRGHCELHIIPAIGWVRLEQLTPGRVEHMMSDLLREHLSESTVRRVRSTLSAALNSAQRDLGLPRNVASLAKTPKSDRPTFQARDDHAGGREGDPGGLPWQTARTARSLRRGHRRDTRTRYPSRWTATWARSTRRWAMQWTTNPTKNRRRTRVQLGYGVVADS